MLVDCLTHSTALSYTIFIVETGKVMDSVYFFVGRDGDVVPTQQMSHKQKFLRKLLFSWWKEQMGL